MINNRNAGVRMSAMCAHKNRFFGTISRGVIVLVRFAKHAYFFSSINLGVTRILNNGNMQIPIIKVKIGDRLTPSYANMAF